MSVLYLCDRRACKRCGPECQHTADITHAKNFELANQSGGSEESVYFEKGTKPLVILKTDCLLSSSVQNKIRETLKSQISEGVMFCDGTLEVVKGDANSIVYTVSITAEDHTRNYASHDQRTNGR